MVDSGSTRRERRARARSLGARVHEIPPEEFVHGATRNLGAQLARGDVARLHDPGRGRRRRALARALSRPRARDRRRRRRLRPPAAARGRAPAGAVLPRLPVRARAARAAPRGRRRAHASSRRSSRTSTPRSPRARWEAYPFRGRPDDERGPGVVAPRPARRLRDRVRAERGGPPLARVHDRGSVPALLRLRRLGRARRTSTGDESRAALRRAGARYARERARVALATGQRRWIPYTVVYELGEVRRPAARAAAPSALPTASFAG